MPKLKLIASHEKPAFGTKAETLARLSGRLAHARVLPLYAFTVAQWRESQDAVWQELSTHAWAKDALIVRSSAEREDGLSASHAGAFTSCADVKGKAEFLGAVEEVIVSFGAEARDEDQVLVQPMLTGIRAAGVAFGIDPATGAPYRVISFDASSGRADTVTSGTRAKLTTCYVSAHEPQKPVGLAGKVTQLLEELAQLFGTNAIDIEFAELQDGSLVLLQARPLVNARESIAPEAHQAALSRIAEAISKGQQPHPYLHGGRTVYGVMPDWNPAEIIGIRPRPLALSLYRELVTDAIWAYQRDNYGYGNLRSFPLLVDFEGLPYIDVRVSFNSFIPKDLPPALAGKLADYYLNRLTENPALHDKVEFEILFSCYTIDLKERLRPLAAHGFSQQELDTIASSLIRLTNRILHRETGLWKQDLEKIRQLEERQRVLASGRMGEIDTLYWLLEDCKRYGTLPFAGLARVGFIAMQLLRSLLHTDVISGNEYHAFLSSLECVSTQMAHDVTAVPRDAFLAHYGHLRPGTYDILSPRYDAAPARYFDWKRIDAERTNARNQTPAAFSLSLPQLKAIEAALTRDGIEIDVIGLLEFIKAGIEAREHAKFVFTRSVSDFLERFASLAESHGFTREDCAYADLRDIMALASATHDIKDWLTASIERGRARHALTRCLLLPPLLTSPQDAWHFTLPESMPNYVTQKQAEGEIAGPESESYRGKIVLLESADPGYDWLFTHDVAGFVTRYGGVNSHMAIRAGELGIPAVVGAGEALFDAWSHARKLFIDCMNRQVRIVA